MSMPMERLRRVALWLGLLSVWFHGTADGTRTEARPGVIVIAHRGDHTQAHENSLAAIESAISVGADFVEIDVRRTQDGKHVLLHDSTVNRTTDGTGSLANLTAEEVAVLNLTNRARPDLPPARIPSLVGALKTMRGRVGLYLDFKDGDRRVVAQELREHRMLERTVVYDRYENLAEWRSIEPSLRTIATPKAEVQELAGWQALKKSRLIDLLDGPITDYTRFRVSEAKRAGFIVWPDVEGPWENPGLWSAAVELGVDGLMTDKPGELIAFLRQLGLHN